LTYAEQVLRQATSSRLILDRQHVDGLDDHDTGHQA
jgi:hypothetical protein